MALTLVIPQRPVIAQSQARQEAVITDRPSPSECRQLDDDSVRAAIESITEQRLTAELSGLNYAALVQQHWAETSVERRIDEQIDTAIKEVRDETDWFDRAYSTISKSQAEEFAVAVAEKTYNSEAFRNAMADLTGAIGEDIGGRLERAAADASGPAVSCMRLALEARYGGAIAQSFVQQSEQTLDVASQSGTPDITTGDLVFQGSEAIGGLLLVMTRRMIARMVAQMGRRLAGAIATRIVSSFTGFIGLALIVKDLIDAGRGVFPLIEERMKSDESKQLIKTEIAEAISGFVDENVESISQETASNMFAMWQSFQERYDLLLSLADKNAAFKEFLSQREAQELAKLGEIVELVVEQEGEAAVFRRLEDGSLTTALDQLTLDGVEIARQTRSLDTAIAWSKHAGERIGDVLKFNIYSRIMPEQISRAELDRLIAVDDRTAVYRLAALPGKARERLLSLPPAEIRSLAQRLEEAELLALSRYQNELPDAASRALLDSVSANPERMEKFARRGVQEAVLTSADENAAVDMLLNPGGTFSLFGMVDSFGKVRAGQVQPRVFVEAYTWTLAVAAAALLIFLILVARLIRGRRTTIIVEDRHGREIGRGKE
ncbi:MAG: hypothetical protein ACLFU3_03380 [Dichotomicrobium sp.]